MSLTSVTLRGAEVYLAVGILYFAIYKVCLMLFVALEKRFRIPGLSAN
jgi:polar amino acid transport system permease protein